MRHRLIRLDRYHAVLYDESIQRVIVKDGDGWLALCLLRPVEAEKFLKHWLAKETATPGPSEPRD